MPDRPRAMHVPGSLLQSRYRVSNFDYCTKPSLRLPVPR